MKCTSQVSRGILCVVVSSYDGKKKQGKEWGGTSLVLTARP